MKKCRSLLVLLCTVFQVFFNKVKRPKRMWWVHLMNVTRSQPGRGEFHAQIQEMKMYPDQFYAYFRMHMNKFFELLNLLKNRITKQNTNW